MVHSYFPIIVIFPPRGVQTTEGEEGAVGEAGEEGEGQEGEEGEGETEAIECFFPNFKRIPPPAPPGRIICDCGRDDCC